MKAITGKLFVVVDGLAALYRRYWFLLLLAGCLVLSRMTWDTFLQATAQNGIGVRTDSVEYLWAAQNLAKGLGLGRLDGLGAFKPMTHWPPLYPAFLAVFEKAGIPALDGAR